LTQKGNKQAFRQKNKNNDEKAHSSRNRQHQRRASPLMPAPMIAMDFMSFWIRFDESTLPAKRAV